MLARFYTASTHNGAPESVKGAADERLMGPVEPRVSLILPWAEGLMGKQGGGMAVWRTGRGPTSEDDVGWTQAEGGRPQAGVRAPRSTGYVQW